MDFTVNLNLSPSSSTPVLAKGGVLQPGIVPVLTVGDKTTLIFRFWDGVVSKRILDYTTIKFGSKTSLQDSAAVIFIPNFTESNDSLGYLYSAPLDLNTSELVAALTGKNSVSVVSDVEINYTNGDKQTLQFQHVIRNQVITSTTPATTVSEDYPSPSEIALHSDLTHFVTDSTFATTSTAGISRYATQAETYAGTISNAAVVPSNLIFRKQTNGAIIGGDFSGSSRGSNAIDIQPLRNGSGQIASGISSIAIGSNNACDSYYSASIGCNVNIGGSSYSSSFGYSNSVMYSAFSYAAGCMNGIQNGYYSHAFGYNNYVSSANAFVVGNNRQIFVQNGAEIGINGESIWGAPPEATGTPVPGETGTPTGTPSPGFLVTPKARISLRGDSSSVAFSLPQTDSTFSAAYESEGYEAAGALPVAMWTARLTADGNTLVFSVNVNGTIKQGYVGLS